MGQRWRCLFASVSFLFVFISEASGLPKQVKGWRRSMISDAWAPFPPDWQPAAPDEREKGNPDVPGSPMSPGDRDLSDKDRRIDPMSGKNSPAKGPNRFRALASGRAPALHAASVS